MFPALRRPRAYGELVTSFPHPTGSSVCREQSDICTLKRVNISSIAGLPLTLNLSYLGAMLLRWWQKWHVSHAGSRLSHCAYIIVHTRMQCALVCELGCVYPWNETCREATFASHRRRTVFPRLGAGRHYVTLPPLHWL